jgi:dihydroneopterin aldolase
MATIKLNEIEIYGQHGYYRDEQQLKQRFVVNISFDLDISRAATIDSLDQTVNYEDIIRILKDVFSIPVSLIETLAVKIAKAIKDKYPVIHRIRVEIKKPEVQLDLRLEDVAVEYVLD